MRIGYTFNLKPAAAGASSGASSPVRSFVSPDITPTAAREGSAASCGTAAADRNGGSMRAVVAPEEVAYAEWDAAETVEAVAAALSRAGEVVLLEADADLPFRLREARPDIVFNMAEGAGGRSREAHVPALLELLGVPYTGSDPLTLALTLDKAMTHRVLRSSGVPTPEFVVVAPGAAPPAAGFPLPAVVKPVHEGSSIGVTDAALCRTPHELAARVREVHEVWRQVALVERFLPGREFTCALVGNGDTLRAYPLVELDFSVLPDGANPIYGYEAKWVWDVPAEPLPVFRCPAEVEPDVAEAVAAAAMRAFRALDCRDWARIDVRLDEDGRPRVLEVNALPGVLPDPEQNSCYPKAARAAGLDFDETILAVLEAARARHQN